MEMSPGEGYLRVVTYIEDSMFQLAKHQSISYKYHIGSQYIQ